MPLGRPLALAMRGPSLVPRGAKFSPSSPCSSLWPSPPRKNFACYVPVWSRNGADRFSPGVITEMQQQQKQERTQFRERSSCCDARTPVLVLPVLIGAGCPGHGGSVRFPRCGRAEHGLHPQEAVREQVGRYRRGATQGRPGFALLIRGCFPWCILWASRQHGAPRWFFGAA